MDRPRLTEDELIYEIIAQLHELESDLSLCKHSIERCNSPEVLEVIKYLQVAHMLIGYNRMKLLLRDYGYHVHRLGLNGSDAVVTGYIGVIDTSKGRLVF